MPNVAEHMAANIWTCDSCDAGAFPVRRETLHLSTQLNHNHLYPPALVTPLRHNALLVLDATARCCFK